MPESYERSYVHPSQEITPSAASTAPPLSTADMDIGDEFDDDFDIDDDQLMEVASAIKKEEKQK